MTRVHPLAPVVALDIDGTLGSYYDHFKWFAELYMQEGLTLDWTGTTEFSEALGMDKETYRDIKLAYRQGGMKRCLPLMDDGVNHLVQPIREEGIQVWICTTRPWQRLDNIDPDTQFWINRNLGKVDGVIYGEDKYADLIDIVGLPRILGVVDDLPENTERAAALGLRALLRMGPHNREYWRSRVDDHSFRVVSHSDDIFNWTMEWKRQHEQESDS